MRRAFLLHLERLHDWLARQAHITVLRSPLPRLVEQPREQAERLRDFLGGALDVARMVQAVDPLLYRNRKPAGQSVTA